MGWSSGTRIFDAVVTAVLSEEPFEKKDVILAVIGALEDGDWDCQNDSPYWNHPLVQEALKESGYYDEWEDEE